MNRDIAITVALVGAAFLAGLAVAQTATQTGREPQFKMARSRYGNLSCYQTIHCHYIDTSTRA
jgi:hypothetical protein